MKWARTLRIDAPHGQAAAQASALETGGVRVTLGPVLFDRTYALAEGPGSVDPAELGVRLPQAAWYGEAIIALAIEPTPADALHLLREALGGPGKPAGVIACEAIENMLIVEIAPSVTQPRMVLRVADVELRRLCGSRNTLLLSPLPEDVIAHIAAAALGAPEIAPDRILESLMGFAHVE